MNPTAEKAFARFLAIFAAALVALTLASCTAQQDALLKNFRYKDERVLIDYTSGTLTVLPSIETAPTVNSRKVYTRTREK